MLCDHPGSHSKTFTVDYVHMQNGRNSSLLKSLAIAFGDGLAFGVAMKLTQPVAKRAVTRILHDPVVSSDAPALDALANALESRFQEQAAQLAQQLAGIEAKLAADSKTLHEQDYSIGRRAEESVQRLREEIVGIQREFAEAVGRIVAQHVETQVAERVADLESRVADSLSAVRTEMSAAHREAAESIDALVANRVEAEVRRRTEEIERSLPNRIAAAVNPAVQAAIDQQLGLARAEASLALRQAQEIEQTIESRVAAAVNTAVRTAVDQQVGPARADAAAALRQTEEIGQSIESRIAAAVNAAVQTAMHQQVEPMRAESAELRQRLSDTNTNMFEFILSMGRACRAVESKSAAVLAPPEEPQPAAKETSAAEPAASTANPASGPAEPKPEAPEFSQLNKSGGLWRVPMVSSFLLTAGALLISRYL